MRFIGPVPVSDLLELIRPLSWRAIIPEEAENASQFRAAIPVAAGPRRHCNDGMDAPADIDRLWINARLATLDPAVPGPYGLRESWASGIRGDTIVAIVPSDAAAVRSFRGEVTDCGGRLVTPGLIDCHTHLIFGGSRAAEWEMRLAGVPYVEIAKRGGGILSTVRATRDLTEDELVETALPRLRALAAEGVTCVEIKSGYGLTLEDELKMLRAARRLETLTPIEVSPTLLAAHAVPPEYAGRGDGYVALICDAMIPIAAKEKLAEAVDVFCESIAFTPAQCERVFATAKKHQLQIKGHVEQLSNSGGAALIARHGGWSADHLEYLDDAGVEAMTRAGTTAVLLPGAYYVLREKQKPPVEQLRAARVPMAVATDLNPGTSPFASLRLAMNMACVLFGLTPEDSLAGATREAAKALGRADRLGTLTVGKQADFLVWDATNPAELVCPFGVNPLVERIVRGRVC
jgi:imidazolonepropionase